jgi:hypothetical protein
VSDRSGAMAVTRIALMAATTAKLHLRKAGGHGL